MYIIAGLGNPGTQYAGTRHNAGFSCIDELADKYNISVDTARHKGLIGKGVVEGEKVLLVKPMTYMNNSGECIREVMDYYKADIDDLIVNTLGSLMGIMAYVILQQISFKNQKFEIHELIDISATMLPPMFIAFVAEMFLGDGSLKLLPVHGIVLLCYGIFVYVFLIGDFTRKAKVYYLACYVGIFCLSRVLL